MSTATVPPAVGAAVGGRRVPPAVVAAVWREGLSAVDVPAGSVKLLSVMVGFTSVVEVV